MPFVRRSPFVFPTLLLLATANAQEWKRLVGDLGEPQRSEAAEMALLALGDKAIAPLQFVLTELDLADAAGHARLQAVARIVDLLGEAGGALAGPLDETLAANRKDSTLDVLHALASLAPQSIAKPWHEHFHTVIHELPDLARSYAAFVRFANRSQHQLPVDLDAAKRLLAADNLFERELAAEAFAKMRDPACLDLLRDRLLARDKLPAGHDSLRHNGFTVPMRDDFARRASDAMLAIAPNDPRCVIAHAVRAVVHPYRTVRQQSLQALAGFGPDAAVAVPELMQVATGTDAALVADALKVLGIVGKEAGPHLATLTTLGERTDDAGRIARSLVARLRAMGVTAPPAPVPIDPAVAAAVAKAAADLGAGDDAATAAAAGTLRAHRDLAFPVLLERMRVERSKAPDPVVRLLADFAVARGDIDCTTLSNVIAALHGEMWRAPMMSSSSGADVERRAVHYEAYGRLKLGRDTSLPKLIDRLADEDALLRFAAARELVAHRAAVAAADPTGERARAALLQALTAENPSKVRFTDSQHGHEEHEMAFAAELRGTIALALVDADLPVEQRSTLFEHCLAVPGDATLVAAAVRRYGAAATDAALQKAIADPRGSVAAAAKEVQALRSPGK